MGGEEEQLEYGLAARQRIALAASLARISDYTREAVPTFPDQDAVPGALARVVGSAAADARQLITLAVACERSRGTSWEVIAEALGLGDDGETARERYEAGLAELDQATLESWLLGDDPQSTGIPGGAGGTAATARRLDAWVTGRQVGTGGPPYRPADDPDHLFPVSGHMPPLDTAGHEALLAAAGALISGCLFRSGPDDPHVRRLEVGHARRTVELYERMAAERPSSAGTGPSPSVLRDLLAGARARLARLAASAGMPESTPEEEPLPSARVRAVRRPGLGYRAKIPSPYRGRVPSARPGMHMTARPAPTRAPSMTTAIRQGRQRSRTARPPPAGSPRAGGRPAGRSPGCDVAAAARAGAGLLARFCFPSLARAVPARVPLQTWSRPGSAILPLAHAASVVFVLDALAGGRFHVRVSHEKIRLWQA